MGLSHFFNAMLVACCHSAGFLAGYYIGKPRQTNKYNLFFVGSGMTFLGLRWIYIRREREMLQEIEEMREEQKSLFER